MEHSLCTRYSSKIGNLIAIQPLLQPFSPCHTHFAGEKTKHRELTKVAYPEQHSWMEPGPGPRQPGSAQTLCHCSLSPYPISISFTYPKQLTEFPARLDMKTSREGWLSVKSNIVFQDPEYSHQKNLWPASDLRHDDIRASKQKRNFQHQIKHPLKASIFM